MHNPSPDRPPEEDPQAQLERAFIEEFLQTRGHSLQTLQELPNDKANALLREASLYASGRLTEVESRAHLIHDLHHGSDVMSGRPRGRSE